MKRSLLKFKCQDSSGSGSDKVIESNVDSDSSPGSSPVFLPGPSRPKRPRVASSARPLFVSPSASPSGLQWLALSPRPRSGIPSVVHGHAPTLLTQTHTTVSPRIRASEIVRSNRPHSDTEIIEKSRKSSGNDTESCKSWSSGITMRGYCRICDGILGEKYCVKHRPEASQNITSSSEPTSSSSSPDNRASPAALDPTEYQYPENQLDMPEILLDRYSSSDEN